MKGYTKVNIFGVNVVNLIKLNEMAKEKGWKIQGYRGIGEFYLTIPSCLKPMILEILEIGD